MTVTATAFIACVRTFYISAILFILVIGLHLADIIGPVLPSVVGAVAGLSAVVMVGMAGSYAPED